MKRILLLSVAAVGLIGVGAAVAVHGAHAEHRGGWGVYGGGDGWGHHRGHGRHHGRGVRRDMLQAIRSFDADGDRRLSQEEIDNGQRGLVERFDENGDGAISLDEFGPLMLEVRKQRVVRAFQRFDRDGNATMTLEEFSEPFSNIVARMDRNGDGFLSRDDRRGRGFGRYWRGGGDDDGRRLGSRDERYDDPPADGLDDDSSDVDAQ